MFALRSVLLRGLLLCTAAVVWSGCGDARLSAEGGAPDDDGRGPVDDSGPDNGLGGNDAGTEPDTVPVGDYSCVLIPAVGGDVFVGVGGGVEVGVYQYSIATGEPEVDQQVEFEIVPAGTAAELSVARARTDGDGLAEVRVNAGDVPESLTVQITSACARPIEIDVDVLDLPTGDLRVGFNYPFADVYEISPLQVDLFLTDEMTCRDIERDELPPGAMRTQETGSTLNTTTFERLGVDSGYTVLVTGFGAVGERAARGCLENVLIREDTINEVTVDLYLLPLNPPGTYDVLSYWDFRDALSESGEVGATIVQILDLFEDPGRGIVEFILTLVEDYVGGLIADGIGLFLDLTGLDDVISGAINDLIDSSPLLSDIVTIGRDLRAIIAELEVISKLEIGKLGSDYEVFGIDEWIGLSLYWRLGCDETSPPDCGRIPIVIDSVGLGAMRGEWTGRVLGYNRLEIDRHPVDFEYGRLILFVLENLVLPAITGEPAPVTLEGLMSAIINCDGIGDFVVGGSGDCVGALGIEICDSDIEGFCESFISFTFGGLFEGFVSSLSFDAVLDVRGDVNLINVDDNLDVDHLIDGMYVGSISIGSAPTPFTAAFCGVREGLDIVPVCIEPRTDF